MPWVSVTIQQRLGSERTCSAAWDVVNEARRMRASLATNRDFKELVAALSAEGADFLVVAAR